MESIQHFSHSEHPLILKKLGEKEEEELVCDGCQETIEEKESYYACQEEEECSFYLHKKCADLPREINLPIHRHPLTLFASSPYYYGGSVECNICGRSDWKWFTYHCSLCDFDIDVICSSLLQEGSNILQHEGHPHPLTFNLKPSLFNCDACNTDDTKDLSYFCHTCNFWIHKSCADAPKSITVAHHEDPLLLSYSLPPQHRNFEQFCDICREKVHPAYWVYYCDNCRYLNHLKCATTSNNPRLTAGESEIKAKKGDIESSQIMKLPLPNGESLDPLRLYLVNNIASGYFDEEATDEIRHTLHDHPLRIHNKEADITTNNLQEYNEILCDGCVCPISVPFYSCSECNFFLHRFCADLPQYFQCPCDPEHSVQVKKYEYCYDYFECSICLRASNGFVCECVSCGLEFDIGCACNLIPSRIEHDSHGHPLVRSHLPAREGEENLLCNACGYYGDINQIYSCKACNFNLCIQCVDYRGSVMHEYDRHSIPLTFPPIKNHPSDFICEICEEDINPRFWMYHCQHCNQSFHVDCLSPVDWYSNVKFGGTVNIGDIHQHPLTFVRNSISENASLCDRCGEDGNEKPILECAPCGLKVCISCATQFEA